MTRLKTYAKVLGGILFIGYSITPTILQFLGLYTATGIILTIMILSIIVFFIEAYVCDENGSDISEYFLYASMFTIGNILMTVISVILTVTGVEYLILDLVLTLLVLPLVIVWIAYEIY